MLARLFAPFNTRIVSAAGASCLTGLGARLYHDVTDYHFVRSLYQAVLLHGDQQPFFELAAIALGALLCCAALYIGAPWFVVTTKPPPPDDPAPALIPSVPVVTEAIAPSVPAAPAPTEAPPSVPFKPAA